MDAGAGVDTKLKPVLLVFVSVSFFFSAAGAGVDPAPNAKGTAGVVLAPACCPPKTKPGVTEDADSVVVRVAPNAMAGAASVGLDHDDVFSKANAGLIDDAASSSSPTVTGSEDLDPPAPNENPCVPGANTPFSGIRNDDVPPTAVPNENMVFLLGGSEAPFSAAASTAAGGGTPNENPGIDAPVSVLSPTFFALEENTPVPLAESATWSSFFSSPDAEAPNLTDEEVFVAGAGAATAAPKLKPTNEDVFAVDSGAATAALKPADGNAGMVELSFLALGLAGVLAGVAVGPLNENPPLAKEVPLLNDEAAGVEDAAVPN